MENEALEQVSAPENEIKYSSLIEKNDLEQTQVLNLQKSALTKIENGENISIIESIALSPEVRQMTIESNLIEPQSIDNRYISNLVALDNFARIRQRELSKHKIPTYPDANTFMSTRSSLTLPLPGGGDLVDESELADFGLSNNLNVQIN